MRSTVTPTARPARAAGRPTLAEDQHRDDPDHDPEAGIVLFDLLGGLDDNLPGLIDSHFAGNRCGGLSPDGFHGFYPFVTSMFS
jgi:hypothetical protein